MKKLLMLSIATLLLSNAQAVYTTLEWDGIVESEQLKCYVYFDIGNGEQFYDTQAGTHGWISGETEVPGNCIQPDVNAQSGILVVEEIVNPLDYTGITGNPAYTEGFQENMRKLGYITDVFYPRLASLSTEISNNYSERKGLGCAIQLLVWEINVEAYGTAYDLSQGEFRANVSPADYSLNHEAMNDKVLDYFNEMVTELESMPEDYIPQCYVVVTTKSLDGSPSQNFITTVIPEPATLAILGLGGLLLRKRK